MRFTSVLHSQKGFTLVELIIGMAIFSISMTAILALLHSTIESSIASRDEIIASNLLREQIELIKNMRNTNIRSFTDWDTIRTELSPIDTLTGGVFTVGNDYSATQALYNENGKIIASPVVFRDISVGFPAENDLAGRFERTHLKLDSQNRYTHKSGTGTKFAAFTIITPLIIDTVNPQVGVTDIGGKPQGFILDARVLVRMRSGFREYDLKTVITDWKR